MTKNYLLKSLLLFSVILLAASSVEASAEKTPAPARFDARTFLAINNIASLGDYIQWMEKNLHYRADTGKDLWQGPAETADKRTGDCEDLAFLHAEILKVFGYEPLVIAHGKGKDAHVYTLFKHQGVFYTLENTHLANTHMQSLPQMAIHLAQKENAEYLVRLSYSANSVTFLYRMEQHGNEISLIALQNS